MYASQTKRLCVRGAPSDETRIQHHSSSADTTTGIIHQSGSSSVAAATAITIPSPQILQQQQQQGQTIATNSRLVVVNSLVGGSNNAAASDRNNDNMTASATGNATSDENESPVKTSSTTPMASIFHPSERTSMLQHANNNSSNINNSTNTASDNVEHALIDRLANETLEESKLELLLSIRNLITACNKKKDSLVNNPNFSKIIRLIDEIQSSSNVKTQLALLLCSVAKGGEHNVKVLNDSFVDSKIFNLILSSRDDNLIEACLRCMRSIMSWPKVSRTWMLYENQPPSSNGPQQDNKDISDGDFGPQKIIAYAKNSKSFIIQECVSDIFAATCSRNGDQILLYKSGALPCIVQLLESPSRRVTIAALNWLTAMCLRNSLVSLEVIKAVCPSGTPLLERLIKMMSKDECHELQFLSARCFAQIYRALAPGHMDDDSRIVSHVLPTLVRMVHRDKSPQLRAKAAECIAYLIECETRLQNTASICDHLIESLANMLEYEQNATLSDLRNYPQVYTNYRCSREQIVWRSNAIQRQQSPPIFELSGSHIDSATKVDSVGDINSELNQEMKRSAFLALAALASHLEPIRKKIFNTCSVMQHLVKSLTDSDTKTLKAVLTCLLSLSRSVQQLRTSFAESSVYSALKNLLSTSSNDVLILVLAILCNLSLDFSPGKQHFLDATTIGTLCSLTRGSDSYLRLHGMWILMNMVYQLKDQNLKFQILRTLGPNHVLNILETENDEELVLKTLGFLRNLLSQRPHIDAIMSNHGEQIMLSLIRVLERSCSARIKEQTLCVLTNIADGIDSKALIMNNRAVLSYLARTICDEQAGDMRLAAICCITNLAHKEQEGSYERRDEMKKFGIEEKLKSMLNTNDPILSDRVRTAYNQFLIGVDDKYVAW